MRSGPAPHHADRYLRPTARLLIAPGGEGSVCDTAPQAPGAKGCHHVRFADPQHWGGCRSASGCFDFQPRTIHRGRVRDHPGVERQAHRVTVLERIAGA